MSYMFSHIECYARVAGAGKAGGRDIASVIAEAARQPGACPHVHNPQAPIIRYGCSPEEVVDRAVRWAETSKDAKGRKLRRDGLCLVAGVISFPADRPAEWFAYRDNCIKYLKKKYGSRLLSVIEHIDEAYPHIHYFCVPLAGERLEVLHPGRAAAAAAKATGKKKSEQNKAYKDAMRAWQDDFWRNVGVRHGLARLGPGKRRLTRAQWKAEQNAAKSISCTLTQIQDESEQIDFIKENLEKAAELQAIERTNNDRERVRLSEIIRKIKDKRLKIYAEDLVRQHEDLQALKLQKKRDSVWGEFINPPKSLTLKQIERRKKIIKDYDYLRFPEQIRGKAVEHSRYGSTELDKIAESRRKIRNQVASLGSIDMLREQLKKCNSWQLRKKKRVSIEIKKIETTQVWADAEMKKLDQKEKKFIADCPSELVNKYQKEKEEEREKAVQALLQLEHQESQEQQKADAEVCRQEHQLSNGRMELCPRP